MYRLRIKYAIRVGLAILILSAIFAFGYLSSASQNIGDEISDALDEDESSPFSKSYCIIGLIPPPPEIELDNATESEILEYIEEYMAYIFFEVEIIIDAGESVGVKRGNYFFIVGKKFEVLDPKAKQSVRKGLAEVIEVREKTASLKLEGIYIGDVTGLHGGFDGIYVGDEVEKLSQKDFEEYRIYQQRVEEFYNKWLSSESEEEKKLLLELLRENAQDFYDHYPDSQWAPRALYHVGWASFQLGQNDIAIQKFNLFLEEYPWHHSAAGAKDFLIEMQNDGVIRWIQENLSIICLIIVVVFGPGVVFKIYPYLKKQKSKKE